MEGESGPPIEQTVLVQEAKVTQVTGQPVERYVTLETRDDSMRPATQPTTASTPASPAQPAHSQPAHSQPAASSSVLQPGGTPLLPRPDGGGGPVPLSTSTPKPPGYLTPTSSPQSVSPPNSPQLDNTPPTSQSPPPPSTVVTMVTSSDAAQTSTSPAPAAAASSSPHVVTAPAAAAHATTESTIVGGKRPPGEESPRITLTQPQDDSGLGDVTVSDVTVSVGDTQDSSSSKDATESTANTSRSDTTDRVKAQEPDKSTSQVSTPDPSSDRGRDPERRPGRAGVTFSTSPPARRDVAHVMEYFQEQEKSLQESFLSLPKRATRKQRSPSPNWQQTGGLEHLDNLIKLMEQLTSLKDENSRLRKRCDYLESTKVLLQAKQDLSFDSSSSSSGFLTMQSHKHKAGQRNHSHPRPRMNSAEELDDLENLDSSSDQRPRSRRKLPARSKSTGSLEVPSELLDGKDDKKRSKAGKSIFGKHKDKGSKGSKWQRIKEFFNEDLGKPIKSMREIGRSSNIRYSTSGAGQPRQGNISPDMDSAGSVFSHGGSPPLLSGPGLSGRSKSLIPTSHHSPRVHDLSDDIWMGPPDWWDEWEANKDGANSTNSDVSSVIEVTKMYLTKKEPGLSSPSSPSSPAASPTEGVVSIAPLTEDNVKQEKFLKVGSSLSRRQSSPSLVPSQSSGGAEDDDLDELMSSVGQPKFLHKSSSCKSADLGLSKGEMMSPKGEGRGSKSFHKTAWGRVRNIIRKDSGKRKHRRGERSGIESEEASEVDMEGLDDRDAFSENLAHRSTPKSSPVVIRQQTASKSVSESPPGQGMSPTRSVSGTSPGGNIDMAALLAGNVSDEWNRKMQEWEEKQAMSKKIKTPPQRTSVEDSELESSSFAPEVKTVDLKDFKGKVPDTPSETADESTTSLEVLGAPTINVEEIQKRMTGSFSRKMQEWERLKYKSSSSPSTQREASPDIERKGSHEKKKSERQKSKRSREEKEKEKMERQRERDKQKVITQVEREQIKLEKDKLRIEKERLRALEREAKLVKLKGRLSQDVDQAVMNPVISPLAEYKVTADFARKLHEWELRKGLSHDVSNSIYLEAQKKSIERMRLSQQLGPLSKSDPAPYSSSTSGDGPAKSPSDVPPPLEMPSAAFWDSPEERSPVEKESEVSLGEVEGEGEEEETCTSVTEECLTKSNIASLERANVQLVEELQKKEFEYAAVHEEVIKVNEKLAKVREEHATEMARFHRELAQGAFTGPVKLEVGELESTMGVMEEKIKLMENFGERLASSMESAAVGKWQSIEGEKDVHKQLVELVEQMRGMLVQATQSKEMSQKSMALSNFETLYSQAMKLQVQMNNLRLSHLERNREIMQIKRQLLLQEVNNLLLQADISRRETELYQFHEARRFSHLKRWNTFSGTARQRAHPQVVLPTTVEGVVSRTTTRPGDARPNIPYIAEDVTLASSSFSAPTSPLVSGTGTSYISSQPHSSTIQPPEAPPRRVSPSRDQPANQNVDTRERSTDHMESYIPTPPPVRRDKGVLKSSDPDQSAEQHQEEQLRPEQRTTPSIQPPIDLPASASHPSSSSTPPSTSTSTSVSAAHTSTTPPSSVSQSNDAQPKTDLPPPGSTRESVQAGTKPGIPPTKQQSMKPEPSAISDSIPLFKEIEELKRAKTKVERESPTLIKNDRGGSSPAPSPGRDPHQVSKKGTPTPTIPKQRSLERPRLVKAVSIAEDNSPAEPVMKCIESLNGAQSAQHNSDTKPGSAVASEAASSDLLPPIADPTRRDLPPTSESTRAGSKSPRSPIRQQKILRRQQREDKDTKFKDYRAISPKSSPVIARGKPPLPRSPTPVRRSPSASTRGSTPVDKGPRSKSASDIERNSESPLHSQSQRSIQAAISMFEKRATVCDTEDRHIAMRKTPSPTLHLPCVGLVTRVRRLKPAVELLEESQRYRTGQTVYATRILQRYLPKDDRGRLAVSPSYNKENVSGSYVNAIVQRLSRETSPARSGTSSKTGSNHSLSQTELATRVSRKLASKGSDNKNTNAPLKDLTNGVHAKQPSNKISPERTLSDTNINIQPILRLAPATSNQQYRNSVEVAMVTTASPTTDVSYAIVSTHSITSTSAHDSSFGTETSIASQSLPTLESPSSPQFISALPGEGRGRAHTISEPEPVAGKRPMRVSEAAENIISGQAARSGRGEKKPGRGRKKDESGRSFCPSTSLSPDRRGKGRGKMGTIGVLCKQSMSFDLGVSMYTQEGPEDVSEQKSRKPRSWDPSESAKSPLISSAVDSDPTSTTLSSDVFTSEAGSPGAAIAPLDSGDEGEVALQSAEDDRKKSRRFLDSNWLQKSKRFFKVSK